MSYETMLAAAHRHQKSYGRASAHAIIKRIAGCATLDDVGEDKYQAVATALSMATNGEIDAAGIYARYNRKKKPL